jgi:hypothetical protein
VVVVVVGAIVAVVDVGGTVVTDALVPELLHPDARAIASATEAAMVLRRDIEGFASHRPRTTGDLRVATTTVTCIRDCCSGSKRAVSHPDYAVERRDNCPASSVTVSRRTALVVGSVVGGGVTFGAVSARIATLSCHDANRPPWKAVDSERAV